MTTQAVHAAQRFTATHPCPICGGHDRMTRGLGKRCTGYRMQDGSAVVCTRICDGAVRTIDTPAGDGYVHRLTQPASKGRQSHREESARRSHRTPHGAGRAIAQRERGRLAGTWIYTDVAGAKVFATVRIDRSDGSKTYRPLHRHGDGWRIGDPPGPLPLYRAPALAEVPAVAVVEGEQCADALASLGYPSTCSAHGAQSAEKTDWSQMAGRHVTVWPDMDEPGRGYALDVRRLVLAAGAASARIVDPLAAKSGYVAGADVVDWIKAQRENGATDQELSEALGELLTGPEPAWAQPDAEEEACEVLRPSYRTLTELIADYPRLKPPLVTGLLRRGEVMNLIGPPKARKSWLLADLALSIAAGVPWLGQFATHQSRVLLIDNELHGETLAARLPQVAAARGLDVQTVGQQVCVEVLRGKLRSLPEMDGYFEALEPGAFALIGLDAWYRFLPDTAGENDNAAMAGLYNRLDRIAQRLGCSIVPVHHTTKGAQGTKSIVDVGAGAGAQSRAADTHLIVREHEEPEAVVLDAAVRSWPPLEPLCLRWQYPVWQPARDLDPAAVRVNRTRRRERATHASAKPEVEKWTPERLARELVGQCPRTKAELEILAEDHDGLSNRRLNRLLQLAVGQALIYRHQERPTAPATYSTEAPTV